VQAHFKENRFFLLAEFTYLRRYGCMQQLSEIVSFCAEFCRLDAIKDFPGAVNGLQVENDGNVTRIGASVDAGLRPFQLAADAGVDFLICHHGLFWDPPVPITGSNRAKIKHLLDNNIALFGAHLPLDAHPQIGNNALLAKALGLRADRTFLPYEGTDIGLITGPHSGGRRGLTEQLKGLFPQTYAGIEFGSDNPSAIAILTGSGQSAVPALRAAGVDTLITGELRQHHFNMAQELGLNLYPCGHYATETFGVRALAQAVSEKFDLPWTFLDTACPL
jgi:dinuclear metal center YbgI/SA1388 family protein